MTLETLKEVLQDRIDMLSSSLIDPIFEDARDDQYELVSLESRLEEIRVCLQLVEQLEIDTDHPLMELKDSEIRVVDPVAWGQQPRGDWPNSSFGGAEMEDPLKAAQKLDA